MATGPVHDVLDHVRLAALREDEAARTDGELLARYLARRDEAAFAALVRRHGPMIHGVCRRLLGPADADDAFQAVFLVLVRKAASVRPRERVANWLHGVARHTAQKARADAARRRAKERTAGEMRRPDPSEDAWGPLVALLDEEIRRLPERYRLPIVLCELEGRTHREAARQLGWPVGTVSGRLSRGRALLARRMKRHGAAPPDLAPAAVPPALAAAAVKAATAFAAGSAAAVSTKVIALAEGTVKSMLLTKLQAITAVLLVVLLAGAGAAVAFGSMSGKEGRPPMKADPTPPPADKPPEKAPTDPDPEEKAVRAYVDELRATVKKPSDDHAVYRKVIDPMFYKAVHWAARHDDALVVELIRDYYGPSNPDRGGTALTWAAWLNNPETVGILLDHGAKVGAADDEGRTALHLAVAWGPNMPKLLLDKGADVNARTRAGVTPLMAAATVDAATITEAAIDQAATVHLLLDKGADVNAQDDSGRTALMFAAESGHLGNVKAMLSEGANVRLKDRKGKRAIDLVKPAEDYLHLTGAWTPEGFQRRQDQAEKEAKALRELLERAGGKD